MCSHRQAENMEWVGSIGGPRRFDFTVAGQWEAWRKQGIRLTRLYQRFCRNGISVLTEPSHGRTNGRL